jgi:branched-chain amino acid transport system substrate-binding protein
MRIASVFWVTFVSIVTAAVVGCGSSGSSSNDSQVGVLYSFVGDQSTLDMASLQGAQLAANQINAAGGLLGTPIAFHNADAKSDADVSAQAGGELFVEENLPIVMGLSDTGLALPVAQQAESLNRVFVTSGATGSILTQQAPRSTFLACFSDNQQARAAATFSRGQLGLSSVVVIYDSTSEYSTNLASLYSSDFTRQGGQITASLTFPGATLNAYDVAQQAKSLNPQSIFLAGQPDEVAGLLAALRGQGVAVPIIGGDSYDSIQIYNLSKGVKAGVYFTTHVLLTRQPSTPQIEAFNAAFQDEYGGLPSSGFTALGYDAMNLIALAVNQAGTTEPGAVRSALESIRNYAGVTGTISYSASQHIPTKEVTVVTFQDGTPVLAALIPG